MINSNKYKEKKIDEIKQKIDKQPIYEELFNMLNIQITEDFMQAELLLEQITIGDNYVKITEPTVEILDFLKTKSFTLHTLLPAYESENFKQPVIAWLIKSN